MSFTYVDQGRLVGIVFSVLIASPVYGLELQHVDHKGDCAPFGANYGPDIETWTRVVTPGKDYDMRSKGSEYAFHCKGDQGRFSYVPITGDFDIHVQVAEMDNSPSAASAKAGLQARVDTGAGSVMVYVEVVSDNPRHLDSHYFARRSAIGGSMVSNPKNFDYAYINGRGAKPRFFQRSFPNEWVRLKREGNIFTGFVSKDGVAWHQLCHNLDCSREATWTQVMPATVLVGMHSSGAAEKNAVKADVKFRNLSGFPGTAKSLNNGTGEGSRLRIRKGASSRERGLSAPGTRGKAPRANVR